MTFLRLEGGQEDLVWDNKDLRLTDEWKEVLMSKRAKDFFIEQALEGK